MVELNSPDAEDLSDAEADNILRTEKVFEVRMPLRIQPGFSRALKLNAEAVNVDIVLDMRLTLLESFMLQLRVVGIDKGVLSRLDTWGDAHVNPDGIVVPTPHLHLYKHGHADRFAHPIDPLEFRDIRDVLKTYDDFCSRFNIVRRPRLIIEKG